LVAFRRRDIIEAMDKFGHFRRRAAWIGTVLGLCFASSASAAVSILDDGSHGGPAKILIRSAIHRGDRTALENALDEVTLTAKGRINGVPFVTVELDSPGGDVVEALGMGRAINQRLAMTLVRPEHECVSACVFILMAGAVHTPVNGAEIGVHRPMLVSWTHMNAREAHARFNGLMAYLREYFRALGVSDAAYETMMGTESFDMHDFTPAELDAMHLRGDGPAWQDYFSAKQAFDAAPVPTAQAAAPITREAVPLPPVPEAYRTVVFMPGDFHSRADYFAGTDITPTHFVWDSLDNGREGLGWSGPDIDALLTLLAYAIRETFQPIWWLILVLLFELVRGAYLPWPGLDPDARWTDRWRLKPFR
jgi:hypothetical protein